MFDKVEYWLELCDDDIMATKLSPEYCKNILNRTEEYLCWTKQLLGRLPNPMQAE